MANKSVVVYQGDGGWGGPLTLVPDEKKQYVISVTGGGIHPVAKQIAEMTGTKAVDAFKNPVEKEETLAAVIDCGGTARCGTYPRMRIPTINVKLQAPSGPLAKYMTEDIFVSGTTVNDILYADGTEAIPQPDNQVIEKTITEVEPALEKEEATPQPEKKKGMIGLIDRIGRAAGTFINIMYQAGRETIDTVMTNILPFMAFVATLIGIINYTGIGDFIAKGLSPLASSLWGLMLLGLITGIPFLSPLLAPGAVIAAVVGVLIGTEIANGTIPAHYALPALFAINSQVGMDFGPVGLTLAESKPETVAVGIPAMLFSRLLTGPLAVIIAYFLSFG
ncbi:MAG: PTS glucitol/sorbitol transporter subunit IIB, partial [Enterococcus sp.]